MDENLGAQYALNIAIHTLRERCKNLQQRISALEEENISLRMSCVQKQEDYSMTELEKLKETIMGLTHQKEQQQEKMGMVLNENQELWKKLGKLVIVNTSLGEQLNKITQTVNQSRAPLQHQSALIRSKTFTQDEPMTKFLQKNLELNEKISMELENVSLKLTDSFSKQKIELEQFSNELIDLRSNETVGEHLGFAYIDQIEDNLYEEFESALEDLKLMKQDVLEHSDILRKNLLVLNHLCKEGGLKCKTCANRKNNYFDKYTSTSDLKMGSMDKFTEVPEFSKIENTSSFEAIPPDMEKMCPICSKVFRREVHFTDFQEHVETHFKHQIDSSEVF